MRGHKRRHLPTHLQIRHIAVEIDPIQALHIQAHMPVEHIVHRHHRSHDCQPGRPSRSWPAPSLAATPRIIGGQARTASQPAANPNDPTQPATHLGGPRLASLVVRLRFDLVEGARGHV